MAVPTNIIACGDSASDESITPPKSADTWRSIGELARELAEKAVRK